MHSQHPQFCHQSPFTVSSEGPVAPGGLLDGQHPSVSLLALQELEPCEARQRHEMTRYQVKRSRRSDEVVCLTPDVPETPQ